MSKAAGGKLLIEVNIYFHDACFRLEFKDLSRTFSMSDEVDMFGVVRLP